jgi:hypothetical protein
LVVKRKGLSFVALAKKEILALVVGRQWTKLILVEFIRPLAGKLSNKPFLALFERCKIENKNSLERELLLL